MIVCNVTGEYDAAFGEVAADRIGDLRARGFAAHLFADASKGVFDAQSNSATLLRDTAHNASRDDRP
jgi:hypothetical protein